jgi:hypothetical protein
MVFDMYSKKRKKYIAKTYDLKNSLTKYFFEKEIKIYKLIENDYILS